jgi:hypothetical protein
MRLSSLVSETSSRYTADGFPVWLWSTARQRDLPWIQAEGLIWRPTIWLGGTRKTAIGFYSGSSRLILRVNTSMLDTDQLKHDEDWRGWVSSIRKASLDQPPSELLMYWARLRKFEDPEVAQRLRDATSGKFDPQQLREDLRTQIARVRPDQLWNYPLRVPPTALSVANQAGFYVSLKHQNPA